MGWIPSPGQMGGMYSYVSRRVFKKGPRILMIGLDAAGKTTILHKFGDTVEETMPMSGFSVERSECPHKGVITSFTVCPVGGRNPTRLVVRHFFQDIDSLIFVVDCNDR